MRIVFAVVLLGFLVAGAFIPNQAARRLAETPAPASEPEPAEGRSFSGFPWMGIGGFEMPTSMVCYEEGCYNVTISCGSECFESWRNGNGVGGAAACVLDCKKCEGTC